MDITGLLEAAEGDDWQRLTFPMKCFAQLGVDSSEVNTRFFLVTTGDLSFEISEVVLAERHAGYEAVSCSELLAES